MITSCERVEIAPSTRRQKILRHLQALYPPGTPGELLAYVKKPFKRIFGHPDDLESFADQIVGLDQAGCDTYLTINTLDGAAVRGRGPRARGCEAEVVSVAAIVADIDAGPKPGHDYPTQLEIHKALLEMPRYPSMVVASGRKNGGLHVYWLLDKPYLIRDQADRHRLKNISRRMQELLRSKLDGREMDSTYDLVRVLRPIGSTNHKYGTVVLESYELDPAMKAHAEASLGASLEDVPYDRDDIDEIEAALPPPPPLPDLNLPPIETADEHQAAAVVCAAKWLIRRAPAIAASHGGGGGDAHTYNTAVCLVHGFGLPIDAALPLMWHWNQRCLPPWTQDGLRRKLHCADAWGGNRPRGWLCSMAMSDHGQLSDLNEAHHDDISTELLYCPTPKTFKMRALDAPEPIRMALPCGNRRCCEACRSNWVVRNYRAIDRALADAFVPSRPPDGIADPSPRIYTGEVDAAGLRAACKYLERGKKRSGASPHYVAILRPGGTRLLITLAPYAPRCRPLPDPSQLRKEIHQALQEVPMNGNRGVTHSQGWLAKEKRPRRYALLNSRDREMMETCQTDLTMTPASR
jgi:hypothetical protein